MADNQQPWVPAPQNRRNQPLGKGTTSVGRKYRRQMEFIAFKKELGLEYWDVSPEIESYLGERGREEAIMRTRKLSGPIHEQAQGLRKAKASQKSPSPSPSPSSRGRSRSPAKALEKRDTGRSSSSSSDSSNASSQAPTLKLGGQQSDAEMEQVEDPDLKGWKISPEEKEKAQLSHDFPMVRRGKKGQPASSSLEQRHSSSSSSSVYKRLSLEQRLDRPLSPERPPRKLPDRSKSEPKGFKGNHGTALGKGNPPVVIRRLPPALASDIAVPLPKVQPKARPTSKQQPALGKGKPKGKAKGPLGKGYPDFQQVAPPQPPLAVPEPPDPGMPVVVVDWANTLVVDNVCSGANIKALRRLCQVAKVAVVSFCGAETAKTVMFNLNSLKAEFQLPLRGVIVPCRTGPWGKVQWMQDYDARVIFDDRSDICSEALGKGLVACPITTPWCNHRKLREQWNVRVFGTFADACNWYLNKVWPYPYYED